MAPALPVGDVVDGVRREVARNAFRARNGIKYATGGQWAPVAATDSTTIWQQGKAQLRHYRRDRPPRLQPPVIAFIGLVSRAYILDLWSGNSFVQRVIDAGFETFVLDWGEPDEQDATNTLDTYVEVYLPRAIEAIIEATKCPQVNVIGYCMGGDLALMALAAQPDLPIRNLVLMATPVDFRHMGPLIEALGEGRIDLESLIDETGNIPAAVIDGFFKMRKPTAELVQYANLWQNLWSDDYMQGYQAMGRWIREQIPIPGAAARQLVGDWLGDNAFYENTLRLGGRSISLLDIHVPTLAVIATRDEIVPEPAAAPIADLLANSAVDVLRLDVGHTSLTTGRTAAKVTVPRITEWLAAHSREQE